MSSTTPSATRNSASLDKLQVEKGRSWSTGRLRAIFLISRRSGRVNFGGRPPEYLAANDSNPSALKLWMTSLTRSSEVKAILAMAGHVHPLGRPQHDLGSSPSHHRARAPTHDREELSSLFVGDVSHCHAFCHGTTLPRPGDQSGGRALPTLPVTALANGP